VGVHPGITLVKSDFGYIAVNFQLSLINDLDFLGVRVSVRVGVGVVFVLDAC
jgi:hypothetical protein